MRAGKAFKKLNFGLEAKILGKHLRIQQGQCLRGA